MEVIRGAVNIRDRHRGAVVTIGNFDGVHRGHQAILAAVRGRAEALGRPSMLVCFEPQPREYFDVYNAPARLTRFREKMELLAQQGIDYVCCIKFNEAARSMSTQEFIRMLVAELRVAALYVGDDFRFGRARSGGFGDLQEAGRRNGFEVVNMYTIAHGDERVSSTRIREHLAAGDFALAEELLGHPWSISGKVIHGRRIGRALGAPTANIQLQRYVAPVSGVFAVEALVAGESHFGVANIGVRPTIDDRTPRPILEVHLFDFDRDIYGRRVRVIFRSKLRDEKKFADTAALKAAIRQDIRQARTCFEAA